jgi:ribosome-associated toxin RatA of RatAB toxin-antitoxin module
LIDVEIYKNKNKNKKEHPMKWLNTFTATALLCISTLTLAEVGPWGLEAHNKDNDIQVFTRVVENSPLKEFKGVTHIKADVASFVALLLDFEMATSWLHNVIEFKVMDAPSDTESVIYTVNKTPWPITNRDVYIRTAMSADKLGAVTLSFTAESNSAEKNKDYIHMPELVGTWIFTPMEEGMVEVTYQVHANPGGSLPNWMVNAIVIETPLKTLLNLRKVIKSEKYQNKSYGFLDKALAIGQGVGPDQRVL